MSGYIRSQQGKEWLEGNVYLSMIQACKHVIDEARRLESEMRDHLQLQVGNLSLEESRKSIELSNFQVQEGKRG